MDSPDQSSRVTTSGPVAVLASVAAFVAIVAVLIVTLGDHTDSGSSDGVAIPSSTSSAADPSATTTSPLSATSTVPLSTGPQAVGAAPADIATATVLLAQLDDDGNHVCYIGSGSIIDPTGIILTNAHVVMSDPTCSYTKLGVEITTRTDTPPELLYLAEVAGYDAALDLATVRIISDLEGDPVDLTGLPFLELGDSDTVEVGDHISMIGYPAIGGSTVTVTEGIVSGFASEPAVTDNRAWIKTDATVSGGNSGGAATNDEGQLIGVPTTAGIQGQLTVDCRVLEDTNGDGLVNSADSCVPIGGFLNGLRPLKLAAPVIAAANRGETTDEWRDRRTVDPIDVLTTASAGNLVFSLGVNPDDTPSEIITTVPSSAESVCAFWDYSGMVDGASYDAIWMIDGTVLESASYLDNTWAGGEAGSWWACMQAPAEITSVAAEFAFLVEGEFLTSEAIYAGDVHQPIKVRINNRSEETVCYIFASPTAALGWGQDELAASEVVSPDQFVELPLTTGRWDVMLQDCDQNTLDIVEGINATGDFTYDYPVVAG